MRTGRPARIRRSLTSISAEGRKYRLADFRGGDDQVDSASFIGDMLGGRSSDHLRAPLEILHHRQGGAELRLDRGGALAKFLEVAVRRLAGPNRHDGGMHRGLPRDDADDGGGKALRHVGDDREQLGVRPIHSHAGHQDGNRRQPNLRGRIVRRSADTNRTSVSAVGLAFAPRTCPNIATGSQIQKLVGLRRGPILPDWAAKPVTACARPVLSGAPGTVSRFAAALTRRRGRSK